MSGGREIVVFDTMMPSTRPPTADFGNILKLAIGKIGRDLEERSASCCVPRALIDPFEQNATVLARLKIAKARRIRR